MELTAVRVRISSGKFLETLGQLEPGAAAKSIQSAAATALSHTRIVRWITRLLPFIELRMGDTVVDVLAPGGATIVHIAATGSFAQAAWRSPQLTPSTPFQHPSPASEHSHISMSCFQGAPLVISFPGQGEHALNPPLTFKLSSVHAVIDVSPVLSPVLSPDVWDDSSTPWKSMPVTVCSIECGELSAEHVALGIIRMVTALQSETSTNPVIVGSSDTCYTVLQVVHGFLDKFHSLGVLLRLRALTLDSVVHGLEGVEGLPELPVSGESDACRKSMIIKSSTLQCTGASISASVAAGQAEGLSGSLSIKADHIGLICNGLAVASVQKPSVRIEKSACCLGLVRALIPQSLNTPLGVAAPLASPLASPPRLLARSSSAIEPDFTRPNSLIVHGDASGVDIRASDALFGIATWGTFVGLKYKTPRSSSQAAGTSVLRVGVRQPKLYLSVSKLTIRALTRTEVELCTLTVRSIVVRPTTVSVLPSPEGKRPGHMHRQQHRVWVKTLAVSVNNSSLPVEVRSAQGVPYQLPPLEREFSSEALTIASISMQIVPRMSSRRSAASAISMGSEVARIIPVIDLSVDGVTLCLSRRLFHSIGILGADGIVRTQPVVALVGMFRGSAEAASGTSSPLLSPTGPPERHSASETDPQLCEIPFHTQRRVPVFSSVLAPSGPRLRTSELHDTSERGVTHAPVPPRSFVAVFGDRLLDHSEIALHSMDDDAGTYIAPGLPARSPEQASFFRSVSGRSAGDFSSPDGFGSVGDVPYAVTSVLGSSFGLSRGFGGTLSNIKVVIPCTISVASATVPLVHEITVASGDFSVHVDSGQWGLRTQSVEFFVRKTPAMAAPLHSTRFTARSPSAADLPSLHHRRSSADGSVYAMPRTVAPPRPRQVNRTCVEFAERAKYLEVCNFAVEETPMKVRAGTGLGSSASSQFDTSIVDIFGEGVRGVWTAALQVALWRGVKDVTRSVWDMLLFLRETGPPTTSNRSYLDVDEAMWLRQLLMCGLSVQGDKLHRLFTKNISIDGKFNIGEQEFPTEDGDPLRTHAPWNCPMNGVFADHLPHAAHAARNVFPLTLRLRVGEFTGVDMPDKWHVEDFAVYLEDFPLFSLASADVLHTVDKHDNLVLGYLGLSLRQRLRCMNAAQGLFPIGFIPPALQPSVGSKFSHRMLQSLMFGEEGLLVDVLGCKIQVPHQVQLGPLVDAIGYHAEALTKVILEMTDGWHANDERHWTYFKRPPPSGFELRGELPIPTLLQGAIAGTSTAAVCPVPSSPTIWLRCRTVSFGIMDDPWETWLESKREVWRKFIAEAHVYGAMLAQTGPKRAPTGSCLTPKPLLHVSLDTGDIDVTITPVWCPDSGILVDEAGSAVQAWKSASLATVFPDDSSSPYLGVTLSPSDIRCFLAAMERIETLGDCKLPRLVPLGAPSIGAAVTPSSQNAAAAALEPFVTSVFCSLLSDSSVDIDVLSLSRRREERSTVEQIMILLKDGMRLVLGEEYIHAAALFSQASELSGGSTNTVVVSQILSCMACNHGCSGDFLVAATLFQRAAVLCRNSGNRTLATKMKLGAILCYACADDVVSVEQEVIECSSWITDHRALASFCGAASRWLSSCPSLDVPGKRRVILTYASSLFSTSDELSGGLHLLSSCYPEMVAITKTTVALSFDGMEIRLRDFGFPLAGVGKVVGNCDMFIAQQSVEKRHVKNIQVHLGNVPEVKVLRQMCPVKVYGTLDVNVDKVDFSYSPGHDYAIAEVFHATRRLLPTAVDPSPHIPYWDVIRHVMHVKGKVGLRTGTARLLSSSDPTKCEEYLEMTVKFARIVHDRAGDFGLQLESAEVHQVPCTRPQLALVASLPSTSLRIKMTWTMCSSVHHLYPPVQCPGWFTLPAVATAESQPGFSGAISGDREDTYATFRSSGVTLAISCEIGKALEQRLMAGDSTPSAILVSLNGSMLAWQWGWVQAYQKIPPFPIPQKYGGGLRGAEVSLSGLTDDTTCGHRLQRWIHRREPPVPGFLRHLRALKLAVKATAISADVRESFSNPVGIRASVLGGFGCSLTFREESDILDPFTSGRIVVPVNSPRLWSISSVVCEAADLEVRLTKDQTVASTANLSEPATEWDETHTKLIAVSHFRISQPCAQQLQRLVARNGSGRRLGSVSSQTSPEKREKHAVPPPYLYNCDINGLRVLVNLQVRNTLLVLVDAYLSVVLASIPAFQRPPARFLNPKGDGMSTPLAVKRASQRPLSSAIGDAAHLATWNKLFSITVRGLQISVMDGTKNGIILIAGNTLRVTNHVTSTAHRERVHISISELCAYVAPTDVDVGVVHPWLWNFDNGRPTMYHASSALNASAAQLVRKLVHGHESPSVDLQSTGIFKPITTPFPCKCTIMVTHQLNEHFAAWLLVPVLPAGPSPDDVTTVRVSASITDLTVHVEAKEVAIIHEIVADTLMTPLPDTALFRSQPEPDRDPRFDNFTVKDFYEAKKYLKWEQAGVQYLKWSAVDVVPPRELLQDWRDGLFLVDNRLADLQHQIRMMSERLDWAIKQANMTTKAIPNFEVWFGSDVVHILLLKGALPIADATIRHVIGSAVGYEDTATGLTLSIEKVFVRDLRRDAPYPLVFDVWQEKIASAAYHGAVQDIGQSSMPDYSTAANNSALDPALIAELCADETLMSPPHAISSRTSSHADLLKSEGDTVSRASGMFGASSGSRQMGGDRRVTEAMRRIENGLHVDSAVDRHGGSRTEYPEDTEASRAVLMSGVNLSLDDWESLGEPLPQALLWSSHFSVVMHSDMHPGRDVLRATGGAVPLELAASTASLQSSVKSQSDTPAPVPMFHIQAFIGAPVNGVAVVNHLEINAAPLKVQVSTDFINELIVFFDPKAWKSQKLKEAEECQRSEFIEAASARLPQKSSSGFSLLSNPFHSRRRSSSSVTSGELLESLPAPHSPEAAASSLSGTPGAKQKDAPVILFKYIRMGEFLIFASLKGQRVLEDIEGITLKVHSITVNKKTATMNGLLIKIRNEIIMDILSQAGRNMENIWKYMKRQLRMSGGAGAGVDDDDDADEAAFVATSRPVEYGASVSGSSGSTEIDAAYLLLGARSQPPPVAPTFRSRLKSWIGIGKKT